MRMLMSASSPWHVGSCRRSAVVVLGVRKARAARAVVQLHDAVPEILEAGYRAVLAGDQLPSVITALAVVHAQEILQALAAPGALGPVRILAVPGPAADLRPRGREQVGVRVAA